jgi:hypothetical protein
MPLIFFEKWLNVVIQNGRSAMQKHEFESIKKL